MKRYKVVATTVTFGKYSKEPLQRLEDANCEVITNTIGRPYNEEELVDIAKDADALIVGNDMITKTVINKCSNLKIIAKHGVGVDGIDINTARKNGIIVTNAPGTNAEEVSDLAFGLILTLARNLFPTIRELKHKSWVKSPGISLSNKTLGIIGLGHIGRCSAQRGKGFGMKLLGYDLYKNEEAKKIGVEFVSIDKLIKESDFITLHLPLTNQTKYIINEDRIKMMKDNVIIVNTARSQLIDYEYLEKALISGKVRGFGTDVYDNEPPEFIQIYDLDNVVLTSHLGGSTYESNLKMGNKAVDNVLAVLGGKEAPNIIK